MGIIGGYLMFVHRGPHSPGLSIMFIASLFPMKIAAIVDKSPMT